MRRIIRATSAVNRTAVSKVSTAWDVAGDASEHAGNDGVQAVDLRVVNRIRWSPY